MFQNEYTGFDAAFEEYFTNTRYTLTQEAEADLLALRVIRECGFSLSQAQYRAILKVIQNDTEPITKPVLTQSNELLEALRLRVSFLRKALIDQDLTDKQQRKRIKQERKFQVFD